ncbi:MAG TPA: sugar ABC transporter substrate-binding protein, partial [Chloroflexota bacterium]|nr:sugar ABC transporter substrate-binding protein [Chloroflexota bacterium]
AARVWRDRMLDTTRARATRRALLALGGTLALPALAACGNGGSAKPADTGGPPIEVVFMRTANQAATDAYNAQAAAFNAKQTRYRGRFEAPALAQGETWETKLTTMIAGDAAPDVFLTGQEALPQFAASGTLFTLDTHMKRDAKEFDANDFFPSHLGGGKWLGKQVALTADGCALLTYYNVTLFQQANVPVPKPTWTWNDYLDAARRTTVKDSGGTVTQAGASPTAGANSNQFWLWLWSSGADLFSADPKQVRITEPAALEALQFVVDLTQRHGAASNSPGVSLGNNPEIAGKVAMWNQNRGFFGQLQNVNSFKFNVMPFPRSPRTGGSTTVNVAGQLSIAKNNKRSDAAWEWLKFLTGTEAQIIRSTVQQGGCPSRKSATQHKSYTDVGVPALESLSGNKTFADVLSDAKMARFIPQYVGMTDASNIFNKHFGTALKGDQALPAAMDAATRELEDLLRRQPQPTS